MAPVRNERVRLRGAPLLPCTATRSASRNPVAAAGNHWRATRPTRGFGHRLTVAEHPSVGCVERRPYCRSGINACVTADPARLALRTISHRLAQASVIRRSRRAPGKALAPALARPVARPLRACGSHRGLACFWRGAGRTPYLHSPPFPTRRVSVRPGRCRI